MYPSSIPILKLSDFLSVALYFSLVISFISGESYKCTQDGCACTFTNDSETFEISLKGIAKPDKPFNVTDGTWTYYVDPCYEFSDYGCNDVTMCQKGDGKSFPIATSAISGFSDFVDEKTPVLVTYKPVATRQLKIKLHCASNLLLPKKVVEDPVNTYTIDIYSPYGCPQRVSPTDDSSGSLSTGSILVIIFFVVLLVYLVAGVLFNKYKRGATGKELVPNVEFWSSLPGLIKDGCVFFGKKMKELCGRCCNREGYNEI